jgi:hypothetical protein
MSAYEELVAECCAYGDESDVRAILAEVLRTLKTVTPEMWSDVGEDLGAEGNWLAMLHKSLLEPR